VVYSTRFFAGAITAGAAVIVVPVSTDVQIIRDVQIYQPAPAADRVALYDTATVAVAMVAIGSAGVFAVTQFQGRIVIPPGASMSALSLTTNWTAIVSGYRLTSA
jgi:hypothetical protein